jgi:transcriptional regulator with XRE-family HTH domain
MPTPRAQSDGQAIRRARLACALSAKELADLVGRSVQTIYNIESGANAGRDLLHKLAKALDVEAGSLLVQTQDSEQVVA